MLDFFRPEPHLQPPHLIPCHLRKTHFFFPIQLAGSLSPALIGSNLRQFSQDFSLSTLHCPALPGFLHPTYIWECCLTRYQTQLQTSPYYNTGLDLHHLLGHTSCPDRSASGEMLIQFLPKRHVPAFFQVSKKMIFSFLEYSHTLSRNKQGHLFAIPLLHMRTCSEGTSSK